MNVENFYITNIHLNHIHPQQKYFCAVSTDFQRVVMMVKNNCKIIGGIFVFYKPIYLSLTYQTNSYSLLKIRNDMISQIDFLILLSENRPSTTIKDGLDWFSVTSTDKTNIITSYNESISRNAFSSRIFNLGYSVAFSVFVYENFSKIFES